MPKNIFELSDEELDVLSEQLAESEESRKEYAEMSLLLSVCKTLRQEDISVLGERMLQRLNSRIDALEEENRGRARLPRRRRVFRPVVYFATAVVALLLVFSLTFGIFKSTQHERGVLYANADTTTFYISLPDSSSVWLKPGAELTWKRTPKDQYRLTELQGSAYFNVKENKQSTFLVQTDVLTVKVTGTAFAIADEVAENKVSVILENGEVVLQNPQGVDLFSLLPNQKAVYDRKSGSFTIEPIQANAYMVNHYNRVSLHLVNLDKIIEEVCRLYEVKILVLSHKDKDKLYHMNFDRTNSVEEVVSIIESLTEAELKVII